MAAHALEALGLAVPEGIAKELKRGFLLFAAVSNPIDGTIDEHFKIVLHALLLRPFSTWRQ